MEKLQKKKERIEDLGLDKIEEYFALKKEELSQIKPEQLRHLSNMARLGLQFEKEMNLAKRSTEMNYIRVGKLVSQNKKELIKYIQKNLPQYK